ncbi:hypothetical protein [Neptuniibacter sp. QD34_54]|uniref:hypothetical protein n=1 Tax=Neptuniibacter sp. QD34_54 TaxID=3398208 RepID=UPI0039F4C0C8
MKASCQLRSAFDLLAVPYGYEHSCKITKGVLNQNRFLLTQHKSCFDSDPRASLFRLVDDLNMPLEGAAWLKNNLDQAELIHLGYEDDKGVPLCKLYLEFPYTVPESDLPTSEKSFLLHQAIKWHTEDNRFHITDYRCLPSLSKLEYLSFIYKCLGPSGQSQAVWVEELLMRMCKSELPMMLDVSEPETVRRSFDVNLYDFSIRLGELGSLLKKLFRSFSLSPESVNQFLEQNADRILGHVSGGINRDGEPFITLYFGVEERCG